MKRELTQPQSVKQPQPSKVTARRKMASLRIGTHRRLFRIALNAQLVSAILDKQNPQQPDNVDEKTQGQQELTGGAH